MNVQTAKKIVFLDRDNTLIVDPGYNANPNIILFLPTVLAGLKLLQSHHYQFIIVTNQSGIGRGYYTHADYHRFQTALSQKLASETLPILADYYCPHRPDDHCHCRKPKSGLLTQALADWPIDPAQSVMIGDRPTDIMAARALGIRGCLVNGTHPEEWPDDWGPSPPYFSSFLSAAEWICGGS